MLCRVADDIFWMSRYVERVISVCRLIDVTWHLELDAGELAATSGEFWAPLLGRSKNGAEPGPGTLPNHVRHYLSLDPENSASLVSCVRLARGAAQRIREG